MADNITVLDSAEVETTVATKDLGSGVHASKVVMVDDVGNNFGHADDEIALPVQVTEDIFHYAVHEGMAFSAAMAGANGDLYICFTTPADPVYLHLLYTYGGEGNVGFHVYEGVTASAVGSDQVVYNKNRAALMNGRGASTVIAGNTGTVGSVQTHTSAAWTGGVMINPDGYHASKGGGSVDASHEFVLEASTTYGFHLDNVDNKDLGMILTWFEVPRKV